MFTSIGNLKKSSIYSRPADRRPAEEILYIKDL